MDNTMGWDTPNKIMVGVSFFLTMLFAGYMITLSNPGGIYEAVSSCIGVILIIYWKERNTHMYVFFISALWYSLFWAIRDSLFGFYNHQQWWESVIALWPTVLVLVHFRAPELKCSRKWYYYALASVIHILLCIFMKDTDNEFLAVLTLLALSDNWTFGSRFVLYSFFWYQAYLASTKYMIPQYINLDVVYFVALTPYLASILFLIIKKATRRHG